MHAIPLITFVSLAIPIIAAADPYLTPQEALKKMETPPGFSVDLIAAEPDIVQPIAFTFDARGRIWVVEGNTYPQRAGNPPAGYGAAAATGASADGKPSEAQLKDIFAGQDRILIFGDEDGDGKFESRKVFAENLNLISGIELGFGGVYVGAAPYLLHIPDKNGDDKPDGPPQILLDGWGWQDTHETLNSFVWGPDGWLYGCHGVFTHSRVGRPGTGWEETVEPSGAIPTTASGKRVPLNCAYWRFHPIRREFEIFAHGTSNSWGFDYNEFGDWFSEACVIPHFWHIIQGGYYLRQSNPLGHFNPYVYTNIETIADHVHYIGATPHAGNNVSDAAGGGHAHCGLCIYNGDNFPPEYRGRPLFFNIHGQRINQEHLVSEGSGYAAKHLPDFLKTNDKNFTGVALKVGPDGAVYFIDWYDQQKCHRPEPPVWDRSNGRIYRVKFDKTWKPWKGDVGKMDLNQQMNLALSDNGWGARTAIRSIAQASAVIPDTVNSDPEAHKKLLMERISLVHRAGNGIRAFNPKDSPAPPPIPGAATAAKQMQMVWLAAAALPFGSANNPGSPIFPATFARGVWEGREPECRRWVMNSWEAPASAAKRSRLGMEEANAEFRERLLQTAPVDSPQDRLAVAIALRRAKPGNSPNNASNPFSAPGEKPSDSPVWKHLEALVAHGEDAKDHNLPQMYWYAIEPLVPENPEKALELAAQSKIPLVSQNIFRRLAETEGGVDHLIGAVAKEKTAAGVLFLLKAAKEGLAGRKSAGTPPAWEAAWKTIDDILKRRADAKEERMRAEILDLREGLAVAFGDKRTFPQLRETLTDAKAPLERRTRALRTLAEGRDPDLPPVLLKLLGDSAMRSPVLQSMLSSADPALPGELLARFQDFSATDKNAALAVLAARPAFAEKLLDAMESGKISRSLVPSFIARQVLNLRNDALSARLIKAWGQIGIENSGIKQQISDWKKILDDKYLQKANFPKGRQVFVSVCGTCHTMFGVGGQIGPDLTGSNRADLDYILENILDPNALVGADYQLHVLTMKDGRTLSGMVREKNPQTTKVQLATAAETVATADVAKDEVLAASMMPPGLLATLQKEQVRDLIAYLASPVQVPAAVNLPNIGSDGHIPGALEGESLKPTATRGTATAQQMGQFPLDRWSGTSQLWWTGGKPGDRLTIAFPVAKDGKYAVAGIFTKAIDYGIVQISLDGKPAIDRLDCFNDGVITTGALSLGVADLTAGTHSLTIEILGKHPSAVPGYMFALDCLVLTPAQ